MFLGGSAMKVEPNYEAESFTWREYLQRATCRNVGVNCVKFKFKRETIYEHGVWMPMDSESVCFLGGSAMTVEPNYEAESITWREYLQRATKYAEMGVYSV